MDPGTAKLAKLAMVVVVLTVVAVTLGGLYQIPKYEAAAHILVGEKPPAQETALKGKIQLIPLAPTPEKLKEISQQAERAINSRPVAKEAIRRLELDTSPDKLLDNLVTTQIEGTNFIHLTYEDTHPAAAAQIVNTMAEVSSERISETSGSNLTASVHERARVPDNPTPVSPKPLRNVLLTLVVGLALSGALIVGHHVLRR